MNRTTYDPEKFNLDLATIKKLGEVFEVVVNADEAIEYKEKKCVDSKELDIKDVLKYEKIFADAQRGLIAPENKFQEAFKTENRLEISRIILKEGQVKLTAEHRKAQIEKKKKQIITLIRSRGVDPRTGFPHTQTRIEDAVELAKVSIDEFKSVEEQAKEIINKIKPILPIKFEVKKIEVHVQSHHAHSAHKYLKTFKLLSDHWAPDQSWTGVVEIPGGIEVDFYEQLNRLTHGTVQAKVIN